MNKHPTVKMLALSFLLLIGGSLIAEGFDQHIPKGYVYGPIAFSVFVELNLRSHLRQGHQRRQRKEQPIGCWRRAAATRLMLRAPCRYDHGPVSAWLRAARKVSGCSSPSVLRARTKVSYPRSRAVRTHQAWPASQPGFVQPVACRGGRDRQFAGSGPAFVDRVQSPARTRRALSGRTRGCVPCRGCRDGHRRVPAGLGSMCPGQGHEPARTCSHPGTLFKMVHPHVR